MEKPKIDGSNLSISLLQNSEINDMENTLKKNHIYASTSPKILLEVLTARTTAILFVITYLVFIIGFVLDIRSTIIGFNSSNRILGGNDCVPSLTNQTYISVNGDAGCTYDMDSSSSKWVGIVTDLNNVISVQLRVKLQNFTSVYINHTAVPVSSLDLNNLDIRFNVTAYCCYQGLGCGSSFSSQITVDENAWYTMLTQSEEDVTFSDMYFPSSSTLEFTLFGYVFQNQEALPMRGKVRSYLLFIDYEQDYHPSSSDEPLRVQLLNSTNVQYQFNVVTRPWTPWSYAIGIVLMFSTIGLLVAYVGLLNRYHVKVWLPEQKWILWYLGGVILYQNPVFSVVVWLSRAPTDAVFTSYVFDSSAQAMLFVIWLLFADGLSRKMTKHRVLFYGPKILCGVIIFGCQLVVLTLQFCSLDPANKNRTPLEAVQNWSYEVKVTFCAFSVAFLALLMLWTVWWFYYLYRTGKTLEKLPYMNTRYLQLSYQFFVVQATLVTLYYVFQYFVVIYFVVRDDTFSPFTGYSADTLETLTDNINILFRQQTDLFGKMLFLTVYAFILAFLFLPADIMRDDSHPLLKGLASTFVIDEQEMQVVMHSRRKMMRQLVQYNYDFNQIVGAKAEVFCLDLALSLLSIAFEAYYDPPGYETESGYGVLDLERHGYGLCDYYYDAVNDMFCCVARHAKSNRLVVSFRGSSSKVHWKHNLNFKQRELNLAWLPLTELDAVDGLQDYVTQYRELGEDESDDESEHDDDEEEEETAAGSGGNAGEGGGQRSSAGSEEGPRSNDTETDDRRRSGGGSSTKSKRSRGASSTPKHSFQSSTKSLSNDGSARGSENMRDSFMRSIAGGANTVRKGVVQVATTVGDATQTAVTATTGAVKTAAYFTPGLKRTVASYVHSGFWEAYLGVREFVHRSLRKELVDYPGHVYFCGHSLGGALATIAALDVKLHTLPRVNAYLAMLRVKEMAGGGGIPTPSTVPRQSAWSSRQFLQQNLPVSPPPPHISVDSAGSALSDKPSVKSAEHNPSAISVPPKHTHNRFYADAAAGNRASDLPSSLSSRESVERWRATRPVRRVKASMYNFGSPRVGNAVFTHQYNQQLPDSFRVVVDGDIVCGIPKGGYKHVGTEVMIDSLGAGSIIIDPSYVERRLRTRTKANVSVHSLIVYRKGLEGVKAASLYMRSHVSLMGDQPDTIRLAINAGPLGLRDYQGFDVISDADKAEEPEVKEDALVDPERGRARGVDSDNSSAAGAASVESRLPLVSTSSSVLSSPRNTVVQESAVGSMESAQILERAVAGGNRGQPLSPGVSTRSVKMPATTEPIDEKEARHLENDMIQNASLFAAINREKPSMLQSLRSVVIGGSKKKTADDQDLTLSTSASPMAAAPSRPALPVRHSESSLDRPATGHRSPIQGNAVL